MNVSNSVNTGKRAYGWTAWRNRLLSSARFQRLAARFPLTRPIARHHARDLFDLTAGFVYSQVAFALVETGLIETLRHETLSLAEAGRRAGLPREAALRLLQAGESLRLTQALRSGRWTLGARGAALAGSPGVTAMIAHHHLLYQDLADPLALLRGERRGTLAGLWDYSAAGEGAATYSRLMAASQPMVAAQALAAYDFARHRRLLDVGGGEGAFLAAVAARTPALEIGLFDLPQVTSRAAIRLAGYRTRIHPGDFRRDPLPAGYDLISLVRVLHDHDDAPAAALLARVRQALSPGGRLLVVEPMAKTPGAEPAGHAYFGMYLLAMNSGRPRTPEEIGGLALAAGFRRWRTLRSPLPLVARILVANY